MFIDQDSPIVSKTYMTRIEGLDGDLNRMEKTQCQDIMPTPLNPYSLCYSINRSFESISPESYALSSNIGLCLYLSKS